MVKGWSRCKWITHLFGMIGLLFVSLAATAQTSSSFEDGKTYRIKVGGNNPTSNSTPTKIYLYDSDGTAKCNDLDDSDETQLWIITADTNNEGFYKVKNKATGKYLPPLTNTNTPVTTTTTESSVYLKKNTNTGTTGDWYNILSSSSSNISYNYYNANQIQGYYPNDQKTNFLSSSEWTFERVYSSGKITASADYVTPTADGTTIYRIYSHQSASTITPSGNVIYDKDGRLNSVSDTVLNNYASYWKLVSLSNGKVAIKNLYTGTYVQLRNTKNLCYQTGTQEAAFTIHENANASGYYDILETDNLGFNYTDQNGGEIYSWTPFDGSKDRNSLWRFKSYTLPEDVLHFIEQQQTNYYQPLSNGKVRIKTSRTASGQANRYITDRTGGTNSTTMEYLLSGDDANRQVWVLVASGNGYLLRNYATGNYLNYNNDGGGKTFYIRQNPNDLTKVQIGENSDFSGNGLHYKTADATVVAWAVNTTDEGGAGSNWIFENVELTDDQVLDKFCSIDNTYKTTENGTYIQLRSEASGGVITENTSSHILTIESKDDSNFAQYWKLIAVDSKAGYYQLQNVLTGRYINYTSFNTQHYTQEGEAKSGNNAGFYFEYVDDTRFIPRYGIHPANDMEHALHWSSGRLLTWKAYTHATGITGSVWTLLKTNITEAQVAEAQQKYQNNNTEKANADTYYAAFKSFFTDAACTELADAYKGMTDNELTAALTAAGVASTTLQGIALKVKNNSWDKWEKIFRTREVAPYSSPETWQGILKFGYYYTHLSNPTGIWGSTNNLMYIFVGNDIPDGASVKVRMVSATDSQGEDLGALKKGLNIINPTKSAALYLDYTVPTDGSASSKKIADFPNLAIHIEGGEVDGYFDATRKGIDTDDEWKEMVNDGLFSKPFVMMKGRRIIYQLNASLTKQYIPEKMREIVDFWDWMVDVEHSLMGIEEYKDRWNNVLGFYSCTYNYMFASSYGTYYNENTLSTILNYDTMAAGGGSLWGPAHENGHIHQSLINMIGCTEISNNLFSQVVVHLNGKTSTRLNGRKFWDIANEYAAGTSWHDYELWDRNLLYFKLYLYYQQEGYCPNFYPELFRSLRNDPLNHSKGSQSNPVPASEDFLKFAVKCCEVSGDDLSEFFRAFGFFVPFETRCIGDYGDYYTYCTQEMIDEAIAKMHKYSKPKGNILFIDNHIKHEPAIDHDGNLTGGLRTDYNDEDAVGKCGDVGSYSDYAPGKYASGYKYTKSNNTYTMSGEGAVGFKVYDNDGNLLYFSNQKSFVLPTSVVEKLGGSDPVIKAAQPDGTDITMPNSSATTYELKVYHADATTSDKAVTVYTDGTERTLPQLSINSIAYIVANEAQQSSLPTTLTEATNVVNGNDNTAQNIVLTDKQDFYAPTNFTAATLTYVRSNTAGYNSVCLPFAISSADFGEGAKIEQYNKAVEQNGSVSLYFKETESTLEAGTPCLVYCPETITSWNIVKHNVEVASYTTKTADSFGTLNGSYTNKTIGANNYKLNVAGTAFGVTTDKGSVTAFRCYLTPSGSTANAPRLLNVIHQQQPITAIESTMQNSIQDVQYYDLTGRKVMHPVKGNIYIVKGQKIIK